MAILKCALIAFFCLGFTHALRNAPSSPKLKGSLESEYNPPRNLNEAKGFNDEKVDPSSSVRHGSSYGTNSGGGTGIGVGYGSGSGSGVGSGSGFGYGYGSGGGGSGTGYGSGSGSGSESGSGYGYGYGSGSGSNNDYGPGSGGGMGIGVGVGRGGGNNGYPGWGCPGCDPPFQGPPFLSWPNDPNYRSICFLPPPFPCVPVVGYATDHPTPPGYGIPANSIMHEEHPPISEDGLTRGQADMKPNNETPAPSAERKRPNNGAKVESGLGRDPQVQH